MRCIFFFLTENHWKIAFEPQQGGYFGVHWWQSGPQLKNIRPHSAAKNQSKTGATAPVQSEIQH